MLYSGMLDKKARSTVFLGRRWVSRNMKLLRSKKIEYFDGDNKRGEISLQGPVSIVEKSLEEADGMEHAFEISNSIRNDKPLLVSAPSAIEKEKWLKYIRRTIAGQTWDLATSSARIAQFTEFLPFIRKKEDDFDYDVEAMRVMEEVKRNYNLHHHKAMLTNLRKVATVLDQSDRMKSIAVREQAKSQSRASTIVNYCSLRKQCRNRMGSDFEIMAASGDALRARRSEANFNIPLRSLSTEMARASVGSLSSEGMRKLRVVEESEGERDAALTDSGSLRSRDGGGDDGAESELSEEEIELRMQKVFQCCEDGDVENLRAICDACRSAGLEKTVSDRLDTFGLRPIQVAAAAGSLSCLRLLLGRSGAFGEEGMDGEVSGQKGGVGSEGSEMWSRSRWAGGSPPLHMASSWGRSDALRLLLAEGDKLGGVTTRDDSGRTPLHVAALSGQASTVGVLLEHPECDPNDKSADGISPLSFAVSSGSVATVRLLLDKGASIAGTDTFHCLDGSEFTVNALHLAAEYGHAQVLQLLRDRCASELLDVTRADVGWTAAHYSAYSNSTSCLQICIASGLSAVTGRLPTSSEAPAPAPAPAPVSSPQTARTSSSVSELDETVSESKSPQAPRTVGGHGRVDNGRRIPPSPFSPGNVPLHVACYYGNTEAVAILLQIPDLNSGSSSMDLSNAGDVARVGSDYGGHTHAHAQHVETMLTTKDAQGRSAVHYCAMGDRVSLLQSLVQLGVPGVDQGTVDGRGFPPFFLAIMHAQENVIYHLLESFEGSLEERHPGCGVSPMQLATAYGMREFMATIMGRDMPSADDPAGRSSFLDHGTLSVAEEAAVPLPSATAGEWGEYSRGDDDDDDDDDDDGDGSGDEGEANDDGVRDSIPDFDETLRDSFRHPSQKGGQGAV